MPVSSLVRADQPYLPIFRPDDFREPARKVRRPPRPKLFAAGDCEQACAVVRGVMIETLDRAYCDGGLGAVLWRDSESDELVKVGLNTLAEIQLALFPEEFAKDHGLAARIEAARAGREADSLVPPGGPRRAGAERVAVYADALLTAADRALIEKRRARA